MLLTTTCLKKKSPISVLKCYSKDKHGQIFSKMSHIFNLFKFDKHYTHIQNHPFFVKIGPAKKWVNWANVRFELNSLGIQRNLSEFRLDPTFASFTHFRKGFIFDRNWVIWNAELAHLWVSETNVRLGWISLKILYKMNINHDIWDKFTQIWHLPSLIYF